MYIISSFTAFLRSEKKINFQCNIFFESLEFFLSQDNYQPMNVQISKRLTVESARF